MPPKASAGAASGDKSTEELKLLMSIIKQLSGKIDFKQVAADCDIVSAAAASKRYSRFLAANGLSSSSSKLKTHDAENTLADHKDNSGASTELSTKQNKSKRKADASGGSSKKQKVEESTVKDEDDGASD